MGRWNPWFSDKPQNHINICFFISFYRHFTFRRSHTWLAGESFKCLPGRVCSQFIIELKGFPLLSLIPNSFPSISPFYPHYSTNYIPIFCSPWYPHHTAILFPGPQVRLLSGPKFGMLLRRNHKTSNPSLLSCREPWEPWCHRQN